MIDFSNAFINQTNLCGESGFVVWDSEKQDFGNCFQDLAFVLPVQVVEKVFSPSIKFE